MKRFRDYLAEAEQAPRPLEPTPANIAAAKRFLLAKWQERHRERFGDEAGAPLGLSSACKFSSQFAALVFGGTVRGNWWHQWVELPNGQSLDLNDEAADVVSMLRGEIPDDQQAYAKLSFKTLPKSLYQHDKRHMTSRDAKDSNQSVLPRVTTWAREFLAQTPLADE